MKTKEPMVPKGNLEIGSSHSCKLFFYGPREFGAGKSFRLLPKENYESKRRDTYMKRQNHEPGARQVFRRGHIAMFALLFTLAWPAVGYSESLLNGQLECQGKDATFQVMGSAEIGGPLKGRVGPPVGMNLHCGLLVEAINMTLFLHGQDCFHTDSEVLVNESHFICRDDEDELLVLIKNLFDVFFAPPSENAEGIPELQ